MELHIQDPTDAQAPFLHERLLELCNGAIRGAGAFAYATRNGVDLLLNDRVFVDFARQGTFDLVVGIDEVTNVSALDALQEAGRNLPGLTVRAFYHNLGRPVFHPKFCWFRQRTQGFLVVGSGNLTAKGLRGNWEAFGVDRLNVGSANRLETQWAEWITYHASRLRILDDPEVRARAALNVFRRRVAAVAVAGPAEGEGEAPGEPEPTVEFEVLVAEIPRGSERWNQANFDVRTFRNFFGVRRGAVRRIILQHVDSQGELQGLERRPSVSVPSRNFRFELGAGSGLAYPATGRPIAIFVRIAPSTFRYRLSMPGDPHYPTVVAWLDTMEVQRTNRMRRVITNTEVLHQAWPDSPLWVTPLGIQD